MRKVKGRYKIRLNGWYVTFKKKRDAESFAARILSSVRWAI